MLNDDDVEFSSMTGFSYEDDDFSEEMSDDNFDDDFEDDEYEDDFEDDFLEESDNYDEPYDDQEPEDGYDNRIHGFDNGFYNDEEEIEEDSDPADMKG